MQECSRISTELIITTASQSQNWCDPHAQLPDISGEPRLELNFEDFPQSLEYSSILSTQNDELAGIINDPPTDFEHDRQHSSNSISDTPRNPQQFEQQLATPLFEGSNLTCASSSILIMKYAMKHNITKDTLSDLLDLLRLHCPKPNSCPSTYLILFQKTI